MSGLHVLLADARRDRLRAVRDLPASEELAYALRRVVYDDRDAEVRAAAVHRLGLLDLADTAGRVGWLVDALRDRSPLVRDAVLRALATCGDAAARGPVRACISGDRMWWVRRTAIYTLAALASRDELPAFTAALGDPFWRVRQAAVRVLAVIGARDLAARADIAAIGDGVASASTLAFLRSAWGPVVLDAPARAEAASELPRALRDPDPAVVTARLARDDHGATPRALVELLCDPHAPLRVLAAERIADSGDADAYRAALDWLEEPRIPHVADTVEHLLDGLGDPAIAIAEHALACAAERPRAAQWAIGWVVATSSAELVAAARACAVRDPRLRAAAVPIATAAELVAWAAHGELVDAIAAELHERQAYAELAQLAARDQPRTRALQLDAAARVDDWASVERGLADPHHGPRAIATWWCARSGRDVARALGHRDPTVREAAITPGTAAPLVADRDPWVARVAIERLVEASPDVQQLALAAADPWIRARACQLPLADDRALAAVLGLVADDDEMVRSAALDALEHATDLDARVRALAPGELSDAARRIAHAFVHGEALPPAATTIEATPPARRARPAEPARRAFGRADFAIAPLVISGAHELSPRALAAAADAGVDTWFWEPTYDDLTRFLRGRTAPRVIAGSYHADAASIEADIELALRRLRRPVLDAFLLFWSRSPARVDADAFAMLDRIRARGKVRTIGFSTHDRELARAALAVSPWDVVMIRHSAAHPGIERELLPEARARGTAILTFASQCYGRMTSGAGAPSAADCIRYSLAQPGVTACIHAPRRYGEVVARAAVLAQPLLSDAEQAALRTHGIAVRAESQRFNTLLRQPTRDAALAARELLASELPPSDEVEPRSLPRAGRARAARTNLGKTRRI